jgi:hypothetical protein
MKTVTTVLVLALGAVVCAPVSGAVIGVAVSNGKMEVNRSEVIGNANLSDGATLRSTAEPLRIQWTAGGSASLAPHSAAQVYGDRMVLEQGVGVVTTSAVRTVAKGFEVQAERGSQAQVALHNGVVQVAALSGTVRVRGVNGMMLARVPPGRALDFSTDSKPGDVSTMSGLLRSENGKFYLKDQVTSLDVEVRGANVKSGVGQMVEVSGRATPSADRQSQVIEVASLTRVEAEQQGSGARPTTGGASPSGKIAARSSASGMSHGTKVLIGVLVAGGAAGVAVPLATISR